MGAKDETAPFPENRKERLVTLKRKEKVFFLRERRDGGAAGNERLELPVERSGSTWRHYSRSRSRIGTIGRGNARARAVVSFFCQPRVESKNVRRVAPRSQTLLPGLYFFSEKFFVKTSLSEYYHHVGGARPRRPRSRGHTAGAAAPLPTRASIARTRARPRLRPAASLRPRRARRARWRTPPPTRPRRCRTRRRRRCAWWWATCGGACPTRARDVHDAIAEHDGAMAAWATAGRVKLCTNEQE